MTSAGDNSSTAIARRPHDSEASREALLQTARRVFDEVGYERATTREIGERAGVDPALIARYFDSKEGLFLAAIAEPAEGEEEIDGDPRALVELLLRRWEERGHSPISRALASPALTDEARDRTRGIVRDRILASAVRERRARGSRNPDLEAELLVALALGIAVTRSNGTLEALERARLDDLIDALAPILAAL
ncbi:MAG TPA: TetR family transcriptional regulator [Solirubrobacterales bacterium]|jgi:AcrR family transcriptional regulator